MTRNKLMMHIILLGTLAISAITGLKWHMVKTNQHEIKSLGSAYIFYDESVCPNKSKLLEIKAKYSKQVDDTDANQKQFIEENFNKLFIEGCTESENKAS